jgi:hypothetical protein
MADPTGSKKRLFWFAGMGVVAALLVGYLALYWPPTPHGNVQGAIGQRNVHREAQLTDKDVGVAGQPKVTVDDLKKVLASPQFKELAGNANFQNAIASQSFAAIANMPGVASVLSNQNLSYLVNNQSYMGLFHNPNFQQMMADKQFQVAMTAGVMANSHQLDLLISQYNLSGSQQIIIKLCQSTQFQVLLTASQYQFGFLLSNANFSNVLQNANFQILFQNQSALQLFSMPASFTLLSTSQLQSMASQGQLQNLVNNSALQNQIILVASHALNAIN